MFEYQFDINVYYWFRINKKEALAFGILQQALGTGAKVKYGANAGSPLAKAVADAAAGETAAVSALNASHQDAGLFGVVISCEPRVAGQVGKYHAFNFDVFYIICIIVVYFLR